MRKILLLLFCFYCIFPIIAEPADSEASEAPTGPEVPADTDIIVPPMYLEVEDLSVIDIEALIPDEDVIFLSAVELSLPQPADIAIPAAAFALDDGELPEAASEDVPDGAAFYSEAALSAGSSSNISGDINLYRTGGQPDFRLRYFHNGYDGFGGKFAGSGFSYREELIEGELAYNDQDISAELKIYYNEIEHGLQQQADYNSVTHRIPMLDSTLDFGVAEGIELRSGIRASLASMVLSSQTPVYSNVYDIEPETAIWFGDGDYKAGLKLGYSVNGSIPSASQPLLASTSQLLSGGAAFHLGFADSFTVDIDGAALWQDYAAWLFPFDVEISGTAGGVFDYSLRGGYRVDRNSYAELWKSSPFASAPVSASSLPALPFTHGWFGEGSFSWNITDNLAVNASVAFSDLKNILKPSASAYSGLGSVGSADGMLLDAAAEIYLHPADFFSLTAGWKGQLLKDLDFFRPRHSIYADFDISSEDKNLGLILSSGLSVYDSSQSWYSNDYTPILDFEGWVRIADGLVFSVVAEDMVSVFLASGRRIWNNYAGRGASATARIKISL